MTTPNGGPIEALVEKIRSLPPERIGAVADFVDFLRFRQAERQLVRDSARAAQSAFAGVWDNPDDAEYDRL